MADVVTASSATGIGAAIPRVEDRRLLTGKGQYSDDISHPDQAYAVMVRSPHAHAELFGMNTCEARSTASCSVTITHGFGLFWTWRV